MNSVASKTIKARTRLSLLLLTGTMLASLAAPALAQQVAPPPTVSTVPTPTPEAVPVASTIKSITVTGNQRLESQTILSYLRLRVGQSYDRATLDQALKAIAATELFKDYQITDNDDALKNPADENPGINRVTQEGKHRDK